MGSTIVVIHAPTEAEVTSMEELAQKLVQPGKSFLFFFCTKIYFLGSVDATLDSEWIKSQPFQMRVKSLAETLIRNFSVFLL